MAQNSAFQQSNLIQNQQTPINILPPTTQAPQRLVQQLPSGQFIQRPLSVGGGGVQTVMLQQPSSLSSTNSAGLINTSRFGR